MEYQSKRVSIGFERIPMGLAFLTTGPSNLRSPGQRLAKGFEVTTPRLGLTTNLCDWHLRLALTTTAPRDQVGTSAKAMTGASSQ